MNFEYSDKYAEIICNSLLKLRKNDLLSLNTEEKDMEFARIVANKALKITENVVKLVVTENGKVQDVIDFDPDFPAAQGTGFAMLHLLHVNKPLQFNGTLLDTVVDKDDFPSLQKLGHLADPQILGRRIAVPFCVVPVYEPGDIREEKLIEFIMSDVDSSILSCDYREQFLNHADIHSFSVTGENCSFNFTVPEDSLFPTGSIKLSNGRQYVPSVDFDKTVIGVEKDSFSGDLYADYEVFGRRQEGQFSFKDGKLVAYPETKELRRLFEFDENLKKVGYIKAGDKFFQVCLGGSNIEILSPQTEELPDYMNECPYCLKLNLSSNLNAVFRDCEEKSKEIIRKGFFLE